jgi:hypothetical protein
MVDTNVDPRSFWQLAGITLLAWLSVIGFDFLLHASILAPLYAEPHPFLLPPERAFALIPVGYLSFLIIAILIVWLMLKLEIANWRAGFLFGLKLGALVWGAVVIGLISISTAPHLLMVGWFIGQTLETGIAAIVVGAGLGEVKLRRLAAWVLLFVLVAIILAILLQNL